MRFILEINMGNDAMCTNHHLSGALVDVAKRIKKGKAEMPRDLQAPIRDINGNRVGAWKFEQ